MKTRRRLNKILAGVAGEYFVAAELSRRGFVATLTLRNTRGVDILASNADATKSVGIQVKTTRGKDAKWILSKKADTDTAENLVYVFVRLPDSGAPEYHVVPRKVVSESVRQKYQAWLAKPRRDGTSHPETGMRIFRDRENQYRDQWDLLGLG